MNNQVCCHVLFSITDNGRFVVSVYYFPKQFLLMCC